MTPRERHRQEVAESREMIAAFMREVIEFAEKIRRHPARPYASREAEAMAGRGDALAARLWVQIEELDAELASLRRIAND